jgi:hypothetical protein
VPRVVTEKLKTAKKMELEIAVQCRVARFFLVHDTKTGKNVPTEHKMYQLNTK